MSDDTAFADCCFSSRAAAAMTKVPKAVAAADDN
jgi:hypothetical protein